jgi:hypothetical protein
MKKKFSFFLILIIIVLVMYVVWKMVWWYEDVQLEEQRLEELILHIKEPRLRDLEILDFHGTHKGWEWQGSGVARFVFFSESIMKFPQMKKVFAIPIIEESGAYKTKAIIERYTKQDIGNLIGEWVYYRLTDEKYQFTIFVIETTKGFYISAEMIEM